MNKADVVVIGAGAGGGVVAKELAVAGLHVVLLERGRFYHASDCRKDDLRNQRTSILGNNTGPDDEGNPRVAVDLAGKSQRRRGPARAAIRTTPPAWAAAPPPMARWPGDSTPRTSA